jgi:DNA-binding MurR/RpiR family transcriptional regulator
VKKLVTAAAIAKIINVTPATVLRLARKGTIRSPFASRWPED